MPLLQGRGLRGETGGHLVKPRSYIVPAMVEQVVIGTELDLAIGVVRKHG